MKKKQSIIFFSLLYILFLWACSNPLESSIEDPSTEKPSPSQTPDTPGPDEGLKFGDFAITSKAHKDSSDWNKTVQEVFGQSYRAADWYDLIAFYNAGGDLLVLFDELGIKQHDQSAFVTRKGKSCYWGFRYYFAARHEGSLPTGYTFGVHDRIGNYIISLGSWSGARKILAVKKSYNPTPPGDTGKKFSDFAVTLERYKDSSDWDKIINTILGKDYRVADWNDLVAYHKSKGNLLSLYDGLGLKKYGESAYVTRNGKASFNSMRYYFATRHEHKKPSWYLAHTHIDNYLFSLGSWYGSNRILAIKKSAVF